MQITLSKDPRIWNQFLEKIQENTFLQTLQWQEFNQKGGFETWRYEMCDQTEELISVCLIIKIVAKRATFLLIPHGPLIDTKNSDQTQEILRSWTKFWKNLAKYEGCSFVRVQPIMDQNNSNQDLFSNLNFRKAPIHVHTELTTLLDIDSQKYSDKNLLMKMRKTTRQMVKKGLKQIDQGEVKVTYPQEISKEMLEVYQETEKRGGFVAYSDEFLKREWEVFGKAKKAGLICVWHKDRLLSWGMVIHTHSRAFYHQGANILDKNIPGSYLCQWHGILLARQKGAITYDFWGLLLKINQITPGLIFLYSREVLAVKM
jgi:lipid II:glycine glycyltransferase (peptidoglycan interpeptide bridge formation enzyme)